MEPRLSVYPLEHRLRSAVIFIFLFELMGCIYQFVAHIWWAAALSVTLAVLMAAIGLTAAYQKSEGGLLFYAILQMIAIVIQLANMTWVVASVWLVKGTCTEGWHCRGWHHAHGWVLALFILSVVGWIFYVLLKMYAVALALRLRSHVRAARVTEAFEAPRHYEAAYFASQPSYHQPPRSPLVARPEATTYGTSSA